MATAEKQAHALFQAHPSRQWTGKLTDLLPALMREARKDPGPFAWRVLRGGAVVGVRIHPKLMRPELRIARQEPADTPEKQAKFDSEVGTFLNHFGIHPIDGSEPAEDSEEWLIQPPDPADEGKAAARFVQLRRGEVSPGKARCHRCHLAGVTTLKEHTLGAGIEGQACTPHRFEAGAEHTAEVRARLGLDAPKKTIDLMDALVKSLKGEG